jgi:hypothetical protein
VVATEVSLASDDLPFFQHARATSIVVLPFFLSHFSPIHSSLYFFIGDLLQS